MTATTTAARTVDTAATAAPEKPRALEAEVLGSRLVADHMARITLHCSAFADAELFGYDGPDQLVRVLLPRRQGALHLPASQAWWPEIQAMEEQDRPAVRNYTVRRLDRARRELDIDFVLHDDAGPASTWAAIARPGDRVGVISDGARYAPPADTDAYLFVGDESAQPALATIIESLPADARALAVMEAPPGTAPELPTHPGVTAVHLAPAPDGAAGTAALAHLAATRLPGTRPYAFVAGESALATSVRRHLVSQHAMPKDRIYFCGYWRRGVSH